MKTGKQDNLKNWIDFVMHYPRTVIGVSILVTLLMGWNISKIIIDPDIKSMLPADQEIIVSINEMEDIFGGSEMVMISLKSDDIFSEATLKKIQILSDEVEELSIVDRVLSITNMFKISGIEGGFEVQDLIEKIPENEEERSALRQTVMDDDLIYGNIVSKDFQRTSVIAILSVSGGNDTDLKAYQIFHDLKKKYEGPEEIDIAGLPITRRSITMTMQKDMKALLPFGISLMIFLLIFSFRSWAGAFLPFAVVIMSIINTLGLMGLLGMKFSFISVLIPVMLIAIANDYSIHIISHYFEEYSSSTDKHQNSIIHRTMEHLKVPVFLAGITTVIGFLSLQSHVLLPRVSWGCWHHLVWRWRCF